MKRISFKNTAVVAASYIPAIFFLAAGAALLYASFMSFEKVKPVIDGFALDGTVDFFNMTFFTGIIFKLRLSGLLFIGIGTACFCFSRRLADFLVRSADLFIRSFRDLTDHFFRMFFQDGLPHFYGLIVLVLIGTFVRMMFMDQPMRYDEAFTFTNYASKPLYLGLSSYTMPNNHIFNTLMVHMAYKLFGAQPWAFRLPAFIAGVLIIWATYIMARSFYNKNAALLSAGFVAASSPLISYSTNARGYTWICLIFLVLLILAKYLKDNDNAAGWFFFSLLSAIGFYTIPTMLYPFGAVMLWFLVTVAAGGSSINKPVLLKRIVKSFIGTLFLTALLYMPVFLVSGFSALSNQVAQNQMNLSDFTGQLLPFTVNLWQYWNRDIPAALTAVLAAGFFVFLFFRHRITDEKVPLLYSVLIFCMPAVLFLRVVPYKRTFLFLVPLYFVFASCGIIYLMESVAAFLQKGRGAVNAYMAQVRSLMPVLGSVLVVCLSLWIGMDIVNTDAVSNYNDTGTLKDAEQVTVFLKKYLRANDAVISTAPSDALLQYYFDEHSVPSQYLYSDCNLSERVLVVVKNNEQTLHDIFGRKGFVPGNNSPRLIQQYATAKVYELDNSRR